MPKHLFSICSNLVSIDQFSNNLSIFHILEQISSSKLPFTFPQLFVTTLWQRYKNEEAIEFEMKITLNVLKRLSE